MGNGAAPWRQCSRPSSTLPHPANIYETLQGRRFVRNQRTYLRQLAVVGSIIAIERNGLFCMGKSTVEVIEPGQHLREPEMCLSVVRVRAKFRFCDAANTLPVPGFDQRIHGRF